MSFFRNATDKLRRMLGRYDSKGLKHSVRYLNSIRHDIAFYTLTEQSYFADLTTVKNVRNNDFILLSSAYLLREENIEELVKQNKIDATHIGNLAFIALNSTQKEIRFKCLAILVEYKRIIKRITI